MKKLILISILIQLAYIFANDFQNGNIEYSKGNINKAKEYYLKDIEERGETFNTLYNLGSLELNQENKGYSKYYLKKAQLLNPRDKDLINLLPKAGVQKVFFTDNEKKSITLVLLLVFSTLIFTINLLKILNRPVSNSILKISSLLLGLATIASFTLNTLKIIKGNEGVVLNNSVVYISPYNESEESFNVDSGTDVYVTDNFKDYYYIKDKNGRYGWLIKDDLGELWN